MLDVLHMDELFANGFAGRVHIQSWRGRVTSDRLRLIEDHATRFHQKHRVKVASLTIVRAPLELPDQETRDLAAELARTIASKQTASATVIEGEGFWAAAARAALSGIHLLSRTEMRLGAFRSVEEGAAWIAPHADVPAGGLRDLIADTHELRRRHLAFDGAPRS